MEKHQEPVASKQHEKILVDETTLVWQLWSEIDCKIGKLTLARPLMTHDAMMSYTTLLSHKKVHYEEIL